MGKLKGSVLSALSAVTLLGAGLAWITMTPAGAASRASAARGPAAMVRLSGSAAPINGAKLVDLAPSSRRLRVDVTLKVPHPGALEHYIAAISKRSSPLFHHFLRRGEFGARFGPPLGEIAKVESVLKKEGLSVLGAGSDRLVVHLRGTVGAVDRAFHVTIGRYRISSGRVGYANADPPEVPASIASDVQAVIGLNDLHPMGSLLVRDAPVPGGRVATGFHGHAPDVAGPKPCTGATSTAVVGGSLTANQLGSYYAMTPLYGLGSFGQGVHVGIVELEPNLPSDIAAYQTCYGTHATVSYHVVDGGVGKGTGSGEAALDIEGVIGIAPRSTIDVYQGPDDEFYDIASTIVSSDVDKVISISWGDCELDSEPSQLAAEQSLFAEAAAQGQTVLAAAGDAGSTDCLGDPGTIYASSLSVDDPASQPYVLGVGGTSVATSSESVWNDSSYSDGAGGGGTSATWCMPSYQDQAGIPGLIGSRSHSDAADCPASTPYDRQVPDVSADADPATGYTIYYGGEWVTVGGTSAAAPLWAGAAALIDSSPFCADYGSGDPGVLPEGLYGVAATEAAYIYGHGRHEALYDVTKGNNDYTPSGYAGGLYPATAGYDMASGLGSPLLGGLTALGASSNFYPGLAALMCSYYATRLTSSAITSVSPDIGATTSPTSVTITGTGFLAIQGADELEVGSRPVTASCTSSTSCTAVIPPMPAGTVDLRMNVEDLRTSPTSSADELTLTQAPVVRIRSPRSGYQTATTHIVVGYLAGGGSSPVASYDVRYRSASWHSLHLGGYLYPGSWQRSTSTSQALDGVPGDEYCFDVRARASSGVVSAWSADHCTIIPLGARSLRPITHGWSAHAGSSNYLGSDLETTRSGAELRLTGVAANQLALVVTTCPSCRAVTVLVNGRVLKTVSTYSAVTRHRAVIILPALSVVRATVVLRAAGRGRRLVIEGLGVG